jgi:hypothetical protein
MKNTGITMIGLMAVSMLAFASCKKKQDDSVHTRLAGKWKTAQIAGDNNGNGVMDATEVQTAPNVSYTTFISDGTGKDEDGAGLVSGTYTWTLKNNDADIVLKYNSGSANGMQFTLHITALTSTDLNVAVNDSASTQKVWVMMKKQ